MAESFSNLTEASCVVHTFMINGYSATKAMGKTDTLPSKRLAAGSYEWEVHYTSNHDGDCIAFKLVLLGSPRRSGVKAALKCRIFSLRTIGDVPCHLSHVFKRAGESSGWVPLRRRDVLEACGAIIDDSFCVECTITVITEPPADAATEILPPCSDLNRHLGELLENGVGADVTLFVSGKSFKAHKAILASRSPVFMAQFFGHMKEKHSRFVEIKDMEASVFRAMLHFIYTDTVPELDQEQDEDGDAMAQHLLAAADRYGIERLKRMCELKLKAVLGRNK